LPGLSAKRQEALVSGSSTTLDHILLVMFVVVWPLAEWLWFYPRSVRAIRAGVPGARIRLYRNILVPEWGFTACVVALWVSRGRPWSALMFGSSTPLRLGIGFLGVMLFTGLLWLQRRAIFARANGLELVRRGIGAYDSLIPRTSGERRIFNMTAITAGICEEFLFRGFAMWYVRTWFPGGWLGLVLAVVITSIFFGFGHIYLGGQNVLKSGIGGVVFALVALAAGSLWPAIIIHAALDLSSGDLGFRAWGGITAADSAPILPNAS
jgi:membrane protease YdiL (CAAX protease family)